MTTDKTCLPAQAFIPLLFALLWLPLSTGHAAEPATKSSTLIQQKPGDLLCGVKRAVCYSGFRQGQHPNRGNGAVNPSDKEILEDLQMLSRDCSFNLIRVYDSQENSEAVLRLIQQPKLNMKVVLGAWLDSEISNPNCPWLKQSFAQPVLDANNLKNTKEIERAIRLANQYSNIVVAVAVGNEALVDWNDHMVPVDSVIRYVRQVKKSISQPVTVCGHYAWWASHGSALAKELDFVSVHTYPVWEEKDIDEAMAFTSPTFRPSAMRCRTAAWSSPKPVGPPSPRNSAPAPAKKSKNAITTTCSTGPAR